MAPFSPKQVRGRPVTTISQWRSADPSLAAALRDGWNEGTGGRLPIPSAGGASRVSSPAMLPGDETAVVSDGCNAAFVPARGPDCASPPKSPAVRVPGRVADTRLAPSAVALDGTADGNARLSPSLCAPANLDGCSDDEPLLEAAVGRGEHAAGPRTLGTPARSRPPPTSAITPGGAAYRELVMTAITQRLSGETAGISRAAQLLTEFGLRDRTAVAKGSKWRCYVEYCGVAGIDPLPVQESNLLGYIGWLAEQRERKLRSVSHASLAGYLSAIRTTQLQVLGEPLPNYPMVRHAVSAYQWWEETAFPAASRRMGLPAHVVQRIYLLGMVAVAPSVVRDAAMVVFAYIFSGLRDSSVVSLATSDVELTDSSVRARLSYVKGRPASQELPVEYIGGADSPLALIRRWADLRGQHIRFFALPSETIHWRPAFLSAGLSRCLASVGHRAPTGCHYGAHSLRIGAHTVQVLLGIPLEARLARFGWGPRSEPMARLYFDRTIRLCPAGTWAFRASPEPPVSSAS
jgi:hypothetical protein